MPICKLCKAEAQLLRSHVYPDHLYRHVRDDNWRFHAYTQDGLLKIRQQGLWDYLFCQKCEQLLSRNYENYFANFWINENALPDVINEAITLTNVDYLKFKLYHLSILFRASISSQPTFQYINLGPHEEIIRNMLLNNTDDSKYHISAAALVKSDNSVVKGIITFPIRGSFKGHTFYQTIYGGCAWIIKTSSHNLPGLSESGLQENGTLYLLNERWEDFQVVREMGEIIRTRDAHN